MFACDRARPARMFLWPWATCLLLCAFLLVSSDSRAAASEGTEDSDTLTIVGAWFGERSDPRTASELVRLLKQNGDSSRLGKTRTPIAWSCGDRSCLQQAANELHAKRLLLTSFKEINPATRSYLITVRFFDVSKDQVEERDLTCDDCTTQTRLEQTANAVSQLLLKPTPVQPTPPPANTLKLLEAEPARGAELPPVAAPPPPPAAAPTESARPSPPPKEGSPATKLVEQPQLELRIPTSQKVAWFSSGLFAAFLAPAVILTGFASAHQAFCPASFGATGESVKLPAREACLAGTLAPIWFVTVVSGAISIKSFLVGKRARR